MRESPSRGRLEPRPQEPFDQDGRASVSGSFGRPTGAVSPEAQDGGTSRASSANLLA
jgi:hypothetical protein